MAYFPMFIDLEQKSVWIIGGGQVALRKAKKLLPYGADITVFAKEVIKELAEIPNIRIKKETFQTEQLERADAWPEMVIASTNDSELNAEIASICKKKRIPVNVVDDLEQCGFVFPAVVKQGDFSAGICTSGISPTVSVYFKEYLKGGIPENLEDILHWMERKREEIKKKIPNQKKRASFYRVIFEHCIRNERIPSEEEWEQFSKYPITGSVALVGAGCGKADLITIRGLRLLQQCEAVVYDDLIDPELLEYVSETAERIYMGKRSGHHSAPQNEINQKLIELAKQGLNVVRLKGGDPYLFGRGGEEMLALMNAGIPCQEVPGIPSAIGIPAEAGIPVTHRGASRGLHIVTAHTSDTEDGLPEDFDSLAKLSGTLVFMMGLQQLPKIVERLIKAGKCATTPTAVISGGNSPNPVRVCGTLSDIAETVRKKDVMSPVIIMVGEVTTLDFRSL